MKLLMRESIPKSASRSGEMPIVNAIVVVSSKPREGLFSLYATIPVIAPTMRRMAKRVR